MLRIGRWREAPHIPLKAAIAIELYDGLSRRAAIAISDRAEASAHLSEICM